MSLPNGTNARRANLKCCIPKGIPIIVMHKSNPKNRCVSAIQRPPIKNQIIFIVIDKQPPALSLSLIVVPNGHNITTANFNVCSPKGIPIMVINNPMLLTTYSMHVAKPPNSSQMMFPSNFMDSYRRFLLFILGTKVTKN